MCNIAIALTYGIDSETDATAGEVTLIKMFST